MQRGPLLSIAASLGFACVPLGWVLSDRLESQNAFCVSCHLDERTPLHRAKAAAFAAFPAQSLVAAHRQAETEFRCIDCHGGASFKNKLRVKAVAARDALFYLAGRFGEPDDMEHPLWDEDCARCHTRYEPERDDAFHAVTQHNVDFDVTCVTCHRAHPEGDRAAFFYIEPAVVRPACRTCHEEFES